MRRRDFLTFLVLVAIVFGAWQQLKPPVIEDGEVSLDDYVLNSFSRWSGPISKAEASDDVALAADSSIVQDAGTVKGVSTDQVDSGDIAVPKSLLPVEEYYGSPLLLNLTDMLAANNVTLYSEDIVEAFPAPNLGLGSVIKIHRATPIEITDWGKKKTYRTWQTTVGGFLEERKIELGDNDRVDPGPRTELALANDGQAVVVVITRVAITEVKEKEKIDFKKLQKEDPELPRGQTKVDKGQAGERVKTYRVTRENGVEVKRELIKNEITKEPKDEVTVIGTKVLIGKSFTGVSSWYKYDSTKVATDKFKRGTNLRITNLDNGKQLFVKSDGCICDDSSYVVDLHPDYFKQLGGKLSDGLMPHIKVDEVLN